MINPTATTCMEMESGMPNSEHANGINRSEPPATPDAPQAESAAKRLKIIAVGISTHNPERKCGGHSHDRDRDAAPSILMVAPSGIVTEYVSLSSPISSQIFILTGIFAAELLVKKAVIALCFRHLK